MAKKKWFSWGKKKNDEAVNNIEAEEKLIEDIEENIIDIMPIADTGDKFIDIEENTIDSRPIANTDEKIIASEENDEKEIEGNNPDTNKKESKQAKSSFFGRLKDGLKKTRDSITHSIDQVLVSFGKVDEELFEELEETLITSDMGVNTSLMIIEELRAKVKTEKITDINGVRKAIREIISNILTDEEVDLKLTTKPSVIVVIGVNGVGKTTSIGKIAYHLKKQGKKITVAAADTFRAAAIDQLEIWTNRAGVSLVKHSEGSDPSAVIFDAIKHCKSKDCDVLICDTAGRLHTKKNLMEELKKIFRIIVRELPGADIETLLVLDATTGQNAVSQAKTFSEVSHLSGLILTKLDGTAKGGIVVSIKSELDIPVKFIGVGEQMDDLQPFNPTEFASALFGAE